MSAILLHALAVHAIAAGHLTTLRALRAMPAGGVPDPAPQAPPGLAGKVNTILAWGKWGVLICGVERQATVTSGKPLERSFVGLPCLLLAIAWRCIRTK